MLEPAFGNSQLVWAALIGLVLLSLAIGAWLGGLLADRFPRRRELELTLSAAAVAVALPPLCSQPVLNLAATGIAEFAPGLLAGALLAVTLLFALPAILLGTATPWAVRLAVTDVRLAGHAAGRFSAIATLGSLIGAFLPVLWLIPTYGTRWTFYLLALLLLVVVSISALRRVAPVGSNRTAGGRPGARLSDTTFRRARGVGRWPGRARSSLRTRASSTTLRCASGAANAT